MIETGQTLPEATLMRMGPDGPEPVKTSDYFANRTVALFAVPGAFTPTCSAKHLPGFVERADALKAKGVDRIACVSINDVFVMDAWAKSQRVGEAVDMLADGNGKFIEALGLDMDASGFGMGTRAQRFSLVAEDGHVTQVNVETPGEFKVSSADYLLERL